MEHLAYFAGPFYLTSILLEVFLAQRRGIRTYDWKDALASITMGLGNVLISLAFGGVTLFVFFVAYDHRLFEIGAGPWAWIALFFADDFVYYWWHRASHEVRILWAAH